MKGNDFELKSPGNTGLGVMSFFCCFFSGKVFCDSFCLLPVAHRSRNTRNDGGWGNICPQVLFTKIILNELFTDWKHRLFLQLIGYELVTTKQF